jgi:hypothetical protein
MANVPTIRDTSVARTELAMRGDSKKVATYKPRTEASEETKSADISMLTIRTVEIDFHCGVLLRQAEGKDLLLCPSMGLLDLMPRTHLTRNGKSCPAAKPLSGVVVLGSP